MNDEQLRQLLASQPLSKAPAQEWERLRLQLEPRRPLRSWHQRRPLRWGIAVSAVLVLAMGGLWITQDSTSDSWSQVHALSQWGSASGDPAWVAMDVGSP
jgi:hypothetical protein